MRVFRVLACLFFAAMSAPSMWGCVPTTQPSGTRFRVQGTLVENTCAPGFSPLANVTFEVDVSRTGQVAWWRWTGGAGVAGRVEQSGNMRFQFQSEQRAWAADPDNNIVGCSLYQRETVTATKVTLPEGDGGAGDGGDGGLVDATSGDGSSDASLGTVDEELPDLEARQTIQVVPTPGSDCSPIVSAQAFPALPCEATYELIGHRL